MTSKEKAIIQFKEDCQENRNWENNLNRRAYNPFLSIGWKYYYNKYKEFEDIGE